MLLARNGLSIYVILLDKERNKETQAYTVDYQFDPSRSAAKNSNYCSIMPVFDVTDAPVNPGKLAGVM